MKNPPTNPEAPNRSPMAQAFDPLLDPRCVVNRPESQEGWAARWIWFPGQRTAHLHALAVRRMAERCKSIGYPGRFRLPVYHAFFRVSASLSKTQLLRWTGPIGRIQLTIDGEEGSATRREETLLPGRRELSVVMDFGNRIPAFLLEGGELSTGASWEVSLDGRHWVQAESEPALNDPMRLPDESAECMVRIAPLVIAAADTGVLKPVTTPIDQIVLPPGKSVLVDFGHDEIGRICFDATGTGLVGCVMGESPEEAMDGDPAHFEQYPLPPSPMGRVRLPEQCVRFACLTSAGGCTIRDLSFEARVWPVEYRGRFECSDPLLNDIWRAAAATLHSCTHDFIFDGIRRDALPWALDGMTAIESSDCVFFDGEVARNQLVSQLMPRSPSRMDLGITDYPLYVPMGFEHDYLVRGDLEFSRRYRDGLVEILDLYATLRNADGWISGSGSWGCLADWAMVPPFGPDPRGTCTYVQMLLTRAFEIGAEFAERWSESDLARRYRDAATLLRRRIRSEFFDSSRGAYINGYDAAGKRDERLTAPTQVFAILFDLLRPEEYQNVIESVLENPRCRPGNISMNRHWEFAAYAKANRLPQALQFLRTHWGRLLSLGHVRFCEDIRPTDNPVEQLAFYGRPFGNSLCHEWTGAAPIALLSKGVLGISSTAPGFASGELVLRESGLAWFRGATPTPHGIIEWSYHREKGGRLVLPAGVTMKLVGCRLKSGAEIAAGPGEYEVTGRDP